MTRHDIRSYGAVGDGVTLDTGAVQAALDAADRDGGGTVVVPAGASYLIGSIELRSHVELHVESGAVLLGSPRWSDYTARFRVSALSAGVVGASTESSAALVTARDATGVSLTGGGVIDGAGAAFVTGERGPDIHDLPSQRPFLVFFLGCENVTVRDLTLTDSALWTLRLTGCQDVLVHGLRIRGDVRLPNNDGIDLDRCRRVRISDCDIATGDDAISLKTCDEWAEYGACEDITVTGCVLSSRSSALVVGVDVSAPIRNVVFSGCVITEAHRGLAVSIGTGAAGDIENVLFTDMIVHTRLFSENWWGSGEVIMIRAAAWHDGVGRVRGVRFRNVIGHGEAGVVVWAERDGLISDVRFDGVSVELARSTDWPSRRDLRPAATGGGPHHVEVPGFFLHRAGDVRVRDCDVTWAGEWRADYGSALVAEHTPGLVLDDFRGVAARPGIPAIAS